LLLANAIAAKKGKTTSSTSSNKQALKPVTATAPSSSDEPNVIAVVLPLASNYNYDSDKEADISNHDMGVPFKSKHLVWHCQVHRLRNDFPVVTCVLINNGAHVILICPELVDELNLKKCHLHKPEIIDFALNNGLKFVPNCTNT